MDSDNLIKVDFGEGDANLKVSIKEDSATIKLSDETKASYEGVYAIQATVKGKRIFKINRSRKSKHHIRYTYCKYGRTTNGRSNHKGYHSRFTPLSLIHCAVVR